MCNILHKSCYVQVSIILDRFTIFYCLHKFLCSLLKKFQLELQVYQIILKNILEKYIKDICLSLASILKIDEKFSCLLLDPGLRDCAHGVHILG
jgi:hypothetical protein